MKAKIINFIHSLGIEKCGVANFEGKSAIVCLFPYFRGNYEGNLSVYAQSRDYHIITKSYLAKIADYIRTLSPDCQCECFCDIGPERERQLAYSAGLGFYGKNRMLINGELGSYFFIGYVLCDLALEASSPVNMSCASCGRCVSACPGGALSNGFDIERCASHISQKKGVLSPEEQSILRKSGLIFGCDICQRVCPYNGGANAMSDFTEDIIAELKRSDIEKLSNKEFYSKYKNRAFSWRGKNVLLRNIDILQRIQCQ